MGPCWWTCGTSSRFRLGSVRPGSPRSNGRFMADGWDVLRPEQREIAAVFFGLRESEGFVLVGGAALLALGLSDRPTQDVDFFTDDQNRVRIAATALIEATRIRGWAGEVVRDTESFQRLRLSKFDIVLAVDLATDTAAVRPLIQSRLGPTFHPLEHAARKALALFDRAAERDYVDLHQLARTIDKAAILTLAATLDLGFDHFVFAEMLRAIKRFSDEDLPCDASTATAVRTFASQWADELDPRS